MNDQAPSPPLARCPSCYAELSPNAVLCIQCGYHLEKGVYLTPRGEHALPAPAPESGNPYQSPAVTAEQRAGSFHFLSIFWIQGRIPRWQWWGVQLVFFAIAVVFAGMAEEDVIPQWLAAIANGTWLWIALVAQVKRWHDMDRSGFWCLINLIPLFGGVYALIELGFQKGTDGPNSYGDDPRDTNMPTP